MIAGIAALAAAAWMLPMLRGKTMTTRLEKTLLSLVGQLVEKIELLERDVTDLGKRPTEGEMGARVAAVQTKLDAAERALETSRALTEEFRNKNGGLLRQIEELHGELLKKRKR